MIVRADGCYEYHMNHQDVMDAQNAATRPTLEVIIIIVIIITSFIVIIIIVALLQVLSWEYL